MEKERGLSKEEAEKRLLQYGLNEIRDISKRSTLKILFSQIKNNFIVYLLFAAVILSFIVGKTVTSYAIMAVISMVVIVGFIQEYRAEKAISALKSMLVPVSIVIRNGKEHEIPSREIVPGDILILRNGEKIPADCLVLEEHELQVNESLLTGESKEVSKKPFTGQNYSDENMIFMGTYIVNGHCLAKVIHTGMNTKFGKIAGMISTTEKELPLQKKVNQIVKYMVFLAISISLLTGLLIILRESSINEELILNTLILMIALSVSAFPEGFPVVLITTLASGAYKMAKQNAIANRMSIIETLGETTVICSDKTGTITKGEMTVKKIFLNNNLFEVSGTGYNANGEIFLEHKKVILKNHPTLKDLLICGVLCNDAIIERTGEDLEFRTNGSPTESALLILGVKAGIFKDDLECDRLEEIPFSSDRKMMSVLCKVGKNKIVYSKGAPEYILKKCKFIQKDNGIFRITERERKRILNLNRKMNSDSLRTLAFAYRDSRITKKSDLEENLIFLGIAGMEDPAREEVKDAIRLCYHAGIKVKMITGDHEETALAIAKEVGIHGNLLNGEELEMMSDEELSAIIDSVSIFARVRPEHKVKIVKALKANNEVVTVTGDGVNDAPALKEAHIGIAMGKNGTDVSRSVADLTLKDDNFATIVLAIAEGRTIFKNIRKFATYQLSCNLSELAILFFGVLLSPILGWQIPILVALQILFMNLVTDNLPAITLGLNPQSDDSMHTPPRKNSKILNKNLFALMILTAFLMTSFVLLSYFISFNLLNHDSTYSRTLALSTLICLEIVSAFNFRSFRKGVLNRGIMANPYLFYASALSLIATMFVIYSPLNKIFETVPLFLDGYIIALGFSILLILIFDIIKYWNNKKEFFDLEHF